MQFLKYSGAQNSVTLLQMNEYKECRENVANFKQKEMKKEFFYHIENTMISVPKCHQLEPT
jgi:diaminopimelate epimerase